MQGSRRNFLLGLAALGLGCASSRVPSVLGAKAEPPRDLLDPSRTWLFFVGVLEWQDPAFHPFPKEDRRDEELVKALQARGVPKSQTVFLVDDEARHGGIEKSLAKHLSRVGRDDLVWIYYAGHGSQDESGTTYFAPYDVDASDLAHTGWSVPSIVRALDGFEGSAILSADCCHSGALAEEAKKSKRSIFVLASSEADARSTANWTFTECLLAGVKGDARVDLDSDGKIAFDELAKYTDRQMSKIESQRAASVKVGGFDGKLALAKANGTHADEPEDDASERTTRY